MVEYLPVYYSMQEKNAAAATVLVHQVLSHTSHGTDIITLN